MFTIIGIGLNGVISVSTQTLLFIIIMIIIIIVSLDMLIYFLKSKFPKDKTRQSKSQTLAHQEKANQSDDEVVVIEVEFKGYKGTFTYGVGQPNIYKGQYVLVLTRDGIRCAEVVTDSKTVKQSQLKIPPFLLESIICIADEVDLEYYS